MRYVIAFILFFFARFVFSQSGFDRTDTLRPVVIEWRMHPLAEDSLYVWSDTAVSTQTTTAELMFDRSPLALREYGKGMLAGVSVRGASPAHVQVLWYGLPVNSPLNGQTDLNTLPAALFEHTSLVKGGKAAFYGTGGLAGILRLENGIRFGDGSAFKGRYAGGQTGLFHTVWDASRSDKRLYVRAAMERTVDFNYYATDFKPYRNTHGDIRSLHFLADLALKGRSLRSEWHLSRSITDRFLPPPLTTESQARLVNEYYRFVWRTAWVRGAARRQITAGFQTEHYDYYMRFDRMSAGKGTARTWYVRPVWEYRGTNGMQWTAEGEWMAVEGQTLTYPRHVQVHPVLTLGVLKEGHKYYLKSITRKNFNSRFHTPVTGAFTLGYKPKPGQVWQASVSTYSRLPAFNDLYWEPGGNPNLLPERGHEAEVTYTFSERGIYLHTAVYYRHTRNLIRWVPGSSGLWAPVNIDRTEGYGAEIGMRIRRKTGTGMLNVEGSAAWRRILLVETGKPLPYVPPLGAYVRLEWARGPWTWEYTYRHQSAYATDPLHYTRLPGHHVHSTGLHYRYRQLTTGFAIRNLFDSYYELMPAYPMPGREVRWHLRIDIQPKQ
ncbi:MAG: TonB-dependent receptor [Chlorobi bacterium]|nr:TonB-dependent receptor [Chlorobiota bacterium]